MLTAATEQWTGQAFPDWASALSLAILIRRFYLLTPTPDRCPMKPTAMMTLLALAGVASFAQAEPAVIYDMGGKFDKSFNEAAYNGAERWKKESGKPYLDFEIANEAQRDQAMQRMAEKGASPIIGVGFSQASSIEKAAKAFPKLQFAIIDMVVKQPNVESVVFKEIGRAHV